MKFFENALKKLKVVDITLIKLAVFFFTLFLFTVWSGFRNLVLSFDWYWYLILFVIFSVPVLKKVYF